MIRKSKFQILKKIDCEKEKTIIRDIQEKDKEKEREIETKIKKTREICKICKIYSKKKNFLRYKTYIQIFTLQQEFAKLKQGLLSFHIKNKLSEENITQKEDVLKK